MEDTPEHPLIGPALTATVVVKETSQHGRDAT
jgi:hypothetical protein